MRSILSVTALILALGGSLLLAQSNRIKITHGPVVEHAGPNNAIIAWSTNASSATVVHYGTDPNHLAQTAEMPWGALTHRVTLKSLQPGTTYYYQAESSQGATSPVERFTTEGEGPQARKGEPRPELKITNGPVLEHVGDRDATVAWSTDERRGDFQQG